MNDKIKYFFPKVLNRLAHEKNRIWEHFPVEKISLWGLGRVPLKDEFAKRLQEMLGTFAPEFFADIKPEDKETIIRCADQTLKHDFNLLGSGLMHLDPIPWHSDFKSGYTWKKGVFYRKQKIGSTKGSDIKVPWELSRCHHLLWLGEAYLITSDERYAKEVVDQINNWIDENPLMYSVNWTCAMDVAIRAVNWMYALNFISGSESFTDEFVSRVSKSLYQHGFFIGNNLEKVIPYSNNHYSSDIVGLLYLGLLFNKTSKRKCWFRFAKKEFFQDIEIQVLPSGIHYEKSISYHRLMVELYSYPIYMFDRCGIKVPNTIKEKAQRMYEYVANYTKPNGYAPLIADNDDGRFLPFVKRDFRQHSYLLNNSSIENRFVALGIQPLYSPASSISAFFQDAGVAVIHKGEDYLYINHGGYSKKPKDDQILIETHTHNDLLSFELSMDGDDILVDAGTYLYTSSQEGRNAFRSTAKHNTIVVDGEEQNGFTDSFQVKRNVSKSALKQVNEYIFEGEYYTINGGLRHARKFDFEGKELIISDTMEKKGSNHTAKLFFHFGTGIEPNLKSDVIFLNNGHMITFSAKPVQLDIVDDSVSPSFGVLAPSKTAVITYQFENKLQITTIVR